MSSVVRKHKSVVAEAASGHWAGFVPIRVVHEECLKLISPGSTRWDMEVTPIPLPVNQPSCCVYIYFYNTPTPSIPKSATHSLSLGNSLN